jgi:NAD(P)-dependent dehydrogenase (short-subunit alcohol dehydrogenase family)
MANAGKVAFITGAGRGLGREMALAFGAQGWRVAVTGREGIEETAGSINEQSGTAIDIFLDVKQTEQVENATARVLAEWGQIDILVNNAAIEGPTAPLAEVALAQWEETLAVNLTGAYLCDHAVAPHMMVRRSGSIVHISSVAGLRAYPLRAPYAVSKWGLIGLTETLAAELGPYNVRVNAVCPGPVEGERMSRVIARRAQREERSVAEVEQEFKQRIALQRMVNAEDIVALVLFLASDAARSITGQAIRVCGGYGL